MKKILLLLIVCLLATNSLVHATHVVGGTLEYERIGTGSLPNSSRYKIKLKLWRDAAGNPWFPINPLIEVRGDTLGYTSAGFDPYVATYPGGNIYPYSGLDRMNDFTTGAGTSRQFIRDFKISCGSPLDTLTVRTGSMGTSPHNNNTRLAQSSGIPSYENPAYVKSGYGSASAPQFIQDGSASGGYGFAIGVCDAGGTSLGSNMDRTNYTDACDVNQSSPYGRLCVPQFVDSCTFVPKVFIQYAVYIRVVDLPNIPGGYHLKFNLSARNNAILNLENPGGTSFTVYARIPDIAQLDQTVSAFNHITTLTSKIVSTTTSVYFSLTSSTGPNVKDNSTFTGITSTNTVPDPFIAAYTVLGIQNITSINADIITTNRVFVTSISGLVTTITTRIIISTILGVTTTGIGNTSLGFPEVNSITGIGQSISGINAITGAGMSPNLADRVRNSSPRFKTVPPLFVCQYNSVLASLGLNQNPAYDHSAFDADGDSIQYSLVTPNDGSDGTTGPAKTDEMFVGYWRPLTSTDINGTVFTTGMPLYSTTLAGFPYPENVNIATFNPVTFKSPFTDQLPLGNSGSMPGIVLNSSTGMMDIRPVVPPGLYVVSVRAREFRKTPTGIKFLGDITRDYQFRVLTCPLPARAYIGSPTQTTSGLSVCKGVVFPMPNNSTAAAFSTNIFYWDSGKDRYANSLAGSDFYPVRVSSSDGSFITTPLGINTSNATFPTFNFSVPGTYYTKLVVNQRGSKCSDSVFQSVNVHNLKSGWLQFPTGPNYVNTPTTFDPYQPLSIGGFVTVSENTLWSNPETNPIPRVHVSGFSGVSATYPGIATSINGISQSLTNYTGYIDYEWMQSDGSRKRIPPIPATPSKVVFMQWKFGDGNMQNISLSGTNWIPVNGILPGITITAANTLPNTNGGVNLSLPGISYNYPIAGNYNVSLTVYNQYGCSDSLQRQVSVISLSPEVISLTSTGEAICPGESASLSVSGATFYTWMPGSLSGNNVIVSPSVTTTYTIIGNNYSTSTGIKFVTVTVASPLIETNSVKICQGNQGILSASGANTYTWIPGTLSGNSISVNPSITTIYTVTGKDLNNCSAINFATITVSSLPVVTAFTNQVYQGAAATLSASGANTYQWFPGSITGQVISVSSQNYSGVSYSVTGTDLNGCKSTGNITLNIIPVFITVTLTGTDLTFCALPSGSISSFVSGGIGSYSYLWSNGASTQSIAGLGSGMYTLTVTDALGNKNISSATVFPSTLIGALVSTDAIKCNGGQTNATVTGLNGTAPYSYFWSNNTSNAIATQLPAGGYLVTITDANLCQTIVGINIIEPAPISITALGALVCQESTANIQASGAVSYSWLPGSLTGNNINVSPRISTTYTVTGSNSDNCKAMAFATITVLSLPTITMGAIPSTCVNNPVTYLVATITGSTGALWQGKGIPSSFGNGTYNPGNTSPNIVALGGGLFQTSLTYTALNTEATAPGIKFMTISTTGNGVCGPVTVQGAINYQPAQVVSILGPASVLVCKNNPGYSFTVKIINFKVGATYGQWSTSGTGNFTSGANLTTSSSIVNYAPSVSDLSTGNVKLIVTVTSNDGKGYNCKIAFDTLNIAYTNAPSADITTPNPTVCGNNATVNLEAVISGALGATWTGGINPVSSTQTGDNLFATYEPATSEINNGNAKLYLTTNGNLNNCMPALDSIFITIIKNPTVLADGNIICSTITSTLPGDGGITNVNSGINSIELEIFPNPANGSFRIKTSQPIVIEIFNSLGLIISRALVEQEKNFNIPTSGVYLIKGIANDKPVFRKVVIE